MQIQDNPAYENQEEFVDGASNVVDTLCNLNHMISEEADRPDEVRRFARIAHEQLRVMLGLIRRRAGRMEFSPLHHPNPYFRTRQP